MVLFRQTRFQRSYPQVSAKNSLRQNLFASPQLLEIPCSTVEQMKLVNTLCRVKSYSGAL
ncbi:MAG: hypothetical protein ACLPKT_01555, partial [Methylocella sp.]